MKNSKLIIIITIIIALGALVAFAGSSNGKSFNGIPVFALGVGLAFAINWLIFIPSFISQTEKFYDLTGSLTYISVTCWCLYAGVNNSPISWLLGGLVILWSVRLGSFLFSRIHRDGKDDRFDSIKPNFLRFLNAWTIQALWVVLTAGPVFAVISSTSEQSFNIWTFVGLALWAIGFAIEIIADNQKTQFKKNIENKGKFISKGLWSISRHPNYFGEILLWLGISIIAFSHLNGWQYVTLISPIFVYLLLTKVSGVPMLEAKAEKKWGNSEDYKAYKKSTPVLVPKVF